MSDLSEWAYIPELNNEFGFDAPIECQAVVSGRWKPLSDPYWDDCVIQVKWRRAADPQESTP